MALEGKCKLIQAYVQRAEKKPPVLNHIRFVVSRAETKVHPQAAGAYTTVAGTHPKHDLTIPGKNYGADNLHGQISIVKFEVKIKFDACRRINPQQMDKET